MTTPMLCLMLVLLSGGSATAQLEGAFVEGLREILHQLVSSGNPITPEAMGSVSESFTGLEKSIATQFFQRLSTVKEAEELVLQDAVADMQTFQALLFNVKAIGGAVKPKMPEALLNVMGTSAKATLEPTVVAWRKAGAVTLNDALKANIKAATDALQQVISGSNGSVVERLKAKIAGLANGMAKTILSTILQTIDKLVQLQGSASQFSMQPDQDMFLMESEIQISIEQVDKVINREFFQYISTTMLKLTKAQAKQQMEQLARKIYDDQTMSTLLEILLDALQN